MEDGEGGEWDRLVIRGRVLLAEAACVVAGGRSLTPEWLGSAAGWLAGAAQGWEALTGEVPAARAYRPVACSPHLECWLIAWPSGGRLQLHDHGGAAGALRVVSGRLHESGAPADEAGADGRRRLLGPLRTRVLDAGDTVAFGAGYVHDVVGGPGGLATSVHVYSAAVRPMGFWATSRGVLVPVHELPDTVQPVPERGLVRQ